MPAPAAQPSRDAREPCALSDKSSAFQDGTETLNDDIP